MAVYVQDVDRSIALKNLIRVHPSTKQVDAMKQVYAKTVGLDIEDVSMQCSERKDLAYQKFVIDVKITPSNQHEGLNKKERDNLLSGIHNVVVNKTMSGELADDLAEAADVAVFIIRRSIHEENKPEVSTTTEEILTTADIGRASVSFDILVYNKNPSESQKVKMQKIISDLGHVKMEDVRFIVHEVTEAPEEKQNPSSNSTEPASTPFPVTMSAATPWPLKSTAKNAVDVTSTKAPEVKMVTQTIRFDGDYKVVIQDKKEDFLKKCSEVLAPLKCKDVYSGSIVVVVEGKAVQVKAKVLKLVSTGLSVPDFPPLTIAKKDGEPDVGEQKEVRKEADVTKEPTKGDASKKEKMKTEDSKQEKKEEKTKQKAIDDAEKEAKERRILQESNQAKGTGVFRIEVHIIARHEGGLTLRAINDVLDEAFHFIKHESKTGHLDDILEKATGLKVHVDTDSFEESIYTTAPPTVNPTVTPSRNPSKSPTVVPSNPPSVTPTIKPSHIPSTVPTPTTTTPPPTPDRTPKISSNNYVCEANAGMAWVKVEQIAGRGTMDPRHEAVGNMNEFDVTATGKLSDHDVNVIAAPYKGFKRTYMLKSTGVEEFMFVKTNKPFNDGERSWGVGKGAILGKPATSYNRVKEWKRIDYSGDIDGKIFDDNTCTRFIVGGNHHKNCYHKEKVRCVSGGRLCQGLEYPILKNFQLWVYIGPSCDWKHVVSSSNNIRPGPLGSLQRQMIKQGNNQIAIAYSLTSTPSDTSNIDEYESIVQFRFESDARLAQRTETPQECSNSIFFESVLISCLKGKCNLPKKMYTGAGFSTICRNHAYGLVSPPVGEKLCDWQIDDRDYMALYFQYDTAPVNCFGVKQNLTSANVTQAATYGNSRLKAMGIFTRDLNGISTIAEEFVVTPAIQEDKEVRKIGFGPNVAKLSDGGFVVVWDLDFKEVWAQMYWPNGLPRGIEFKIATHPVAYHIPHVTGLNDGGFVVTYSNVDASAQGIFATRFDKDGNPMGKTFGVNTYTKGMQLASRIAAVGDGFVVAWESADQDGDGFGIFSQLYDVNSGKIGAEMQVNTYTDKDQKSPEVLGLTNGYAVCWQSNGQDGSDNGVYAQIFKLDGTKSGSEFQVHTSKAGNQVGCKLGDLTASGFVAVWTSTNVEEDNGNVYAQIFDPIGSKVGLEIKVNEFDKSDQSEPDVLGLEDGSFVVAWQSKNEETDIPNPSFSEYCNGSLSHIGHVEFELQKSTMPPGDLAVRCKDECATEQDCEGYTYNANNVTSSCVLLFYSEQGCMASCQRNKFDHKDLPTDCEKSCKSGSKGKIVGDCDEVEDTNTFSKDPAGYDIYGQKFDMHGNRLGHEFLLNSEDVSGNQKSPSVARIDEGFVAVWQKSPLSNRKVHGQRFLTKLRYRTGLCMPCVGEQTDLSKIEGFCHDGPMFDVENVGECMEKACLPFISCSHVSYSPVKRDCSTYHKNQCDMKSLQVDETYEYVSMERPRRQFRRYAYTGADQTYTVPDGIFLLKVKLWAAGGGGGETKGGPIGKGRGTGDSSGGGGGFTQGHMRVKPGDTFTIVVGSGGAYGCPALAAYGGGGKVGGTGCAGAGGGRSAIVDELGKDLVTAGGGGGGGSDVRSGFGAGGGGEKGRSAHFTHFGKGGGHGGSQDAKGAGGKSEGDQHHGNYGPQNAGGGGGGYYGGGSSTGKDKSGGGGSGYTGGLLEEYSVMTVEGHDGLPNQGGSAGNKVDPEYTFGIGMGGSPGNNGGNGLVLIYEIVEKCEKTEPYTARLTKLEDFQKLAENYPMINSTESGGCYNMQSLDSTDSYEFHCIGPAIGYISWVAKESGAYEIEYTREDQWSPSCPVHLIRNNKTISSVPTGEGHSKGDKVTTLVRAKAGDVFHLMEGVDKDDPKGCGAHLYSIAKLQCITDSTCPFLFTTARKNILECNDGTQCDMVADGEKCCTARMKRAKCPPNKPDMCANEDPLIGDYPCMEKGKCAGGKRTCERTPPSTTAKPFVSLMRKVKDIDNPYNVAPNGTAFASGSYESGYGCTKTTKGTGDVGLQGKYCYTNINDLKMDDQHAWIPQRSGEKFVGIAFENGPINVTGFAISRDMSGKKKDRLGGRYRVQWTLAPNPTADTSKDSWENLQPTFTRDTPLQQFYAFGPPLLCTGLRIVIESSFHKYADLPAIDEFRIFRHVEFERIFDLDRKESEEALAWTTTWDDWLSSNTVFYPSLFILLALLTGIARFLCTKSEVQGDRLTLDMGEPLLEPY